MSPFTSTARSSQQNTPPAAAPTPKHPAPASHSPSAHANTPTPSLGFVRLDTYCRRHQIQSCLLLIACSAAWSHPDMVPALHTHSPSHCTRTQRSTAHQQQTRRCRVRTIVAYTPCSRAAGGGDSNSDWKTSYQALFAEEVGAPAEAPGRATPRRRSASRDRATGTRRPTAA